jgi:molybdate transport system ATP-binding protein
MDDLDVDISLARRSFELRVALRLGAETVALVGASGAGKSSLLRAIAGLDRPQRGRIALGGQVWFDSQRRRNLRPERRRVGFLPQDYGLFPHLSVAANVRFASRRPRPDLLDRLGIGHLADARPGQLSGGERQRVALARALARSPQVLLLDEPFAALDAVTRRQVRDELADELSGLTLPTVVVTHAFEDAVALANRVGVLDEGRLLQLATPNQLLDRPADTTVAALTGANVLAGTATPTAGGSRIDLEGGGVLISTTPRHGPTSVAVQPWQLVPLPPERSELADTILSVRRDRGRLLVRCQRVTVDADPSQFEGLSLAPGNMLGLRADPEHVRVLDGPSHRPPAGEDVQAPPHSAPGAPDDAELPSDPSTATPRSLR